MIFYRIAPLRDGPLEKKLWERGGGEFSRRRIFFRYQILV